MREKTSERSKKEGISRMKKGGTHEENISSGNGGGTLNNGIGDRLYGN